MSPTSGRCAVTRNLVAAVPMLLLVAPLRQGLESRMLLHMLVEFPLLFAAGWALSPRLRLAADLIDVQGLLGVTAASCAAAFWMIPAALDASLLSTPVQGAKLLSWLLAGLLLGRSWSRLADEIKVFFLGNLAWMSATVGMLYQSAGQRLCVNYLYDDQQLAGVALVVLGVALGLLASGIMLRIPGKESVDPNAGDEQPRQESSEAQWRRMRGRGAASSATARQE